MGLDEFLIPREGPPGRPSLPSEGLDDWLVAPPAVPEPPPDGREADATRLPGATPPPPAPQPPIDRTGEGRGPVVGMDAAAEVALIAPPTIDEAGPPTSDAVGSTGPSPFEAPPLATPSPSRPAEATPVDASRLDGFLAAAPLDDPSPIPWPRDLVDDEAVLAPAALLAPSVPDAAPDEGPRRPAGGPTGGDADGFATPGRTGPAREASPFDSRGPAAGGATGEVDGAADDAFERIEGRLVQVAERLERAAERLASPPHSIGSRPRTFRGRIDD